MVACEVLDEVCQPSVGFGRHGDGVGVEYLRRARCALGVGRDRRVQPRGIKVAGE
jgi:hypothetical protein